MQIRKHGERIQLLRAHYVPQAKRSVQEMIGSFPAHCERLDDVPQRIREQLAPQELEQLCGWFETRQLQTHRRNEAFPLPKVQSLLEGLAVFTHLASEVILRADVDEISQHEIHKLNRAVHQLLITFVLRGSALQCIRLLEPVQDHNLLERQLRYLTRLSRENWTELDAEEHSAYEDAWDEAIDTLREILRQPIHSAPRG